MSNGILTRSQKRKLNEGKKTPPPPPKTTKKIILSPPTLPVQPQKNQSLRISHPKTDTKISDLYKNLYFPPAYSGNTRELLNTIETYSVHRPRRKKFKRRTTYVPGKAFCLNHFNSISKGMFHTVFADLVDYRMYDHANSNFKYILVVIG